MNSEGSGYAERPSGYLETVGAEVGLVGLEGRVGQVLAAAPARHPY